MIHLLFLTYKCIKIQKSKYKLSLNYSMDGKKSVASFNLHGTAFTDSFNINIRKKHYWYGCVGFGIEWWVISFICQYGTDINKWPNKKKK